MSAVSTSSLSKSFGELEAVHDVTLEVGAGEVFGLIGPNGAGKTTLIRLLCGLYTPSAGHGSVLGLDIARERARIRERVGYMSQSNGLYGDLSVDENIRLYADLYGVHDPAWIAQVRHWLALQDVGRQVVADLPTGVRQRAALAAVLAHRPQLMVLDEPTSGVDLVAREAMWDLLGEIARGGVTVLVTTHVMAEARRCDRLALIAEGRLVASGAPEELIRRSDVVIAVVDASPWSEAFARVQSLWPAATLFGRRTHIPVPRGEVVEPRVRHVLSGLEVRSVTWREPSMEDAFIALVAAAHE
ncbi:MAG: ATP-binding cassette domain-containing protein [Acidimicrobiales bacterium]